MRQDLKWYAILRLLRDDVNLDSIMTGTQAKGTKRCAFQATSWHTLEADQAAC